MKTVNDGSGATKYGARIIALALLAGSLLGLVGSALSVYLGSSSNLNWLPQSVGFLFGINVVAVLALLYLIRSSRVLNARDRFASLETHIGERFELRVSKSSELVSGS